MSTLMGLQQHVWEKAELLCYWQTGILNRLGTGEQGRRQKDRTLHGREAKGKKIVKDEFSSYTCCEGCY